MRKITVKTRQNVEITYRLASLGMRIAAFLIDAFIVYFSIFAIAVIAGALDSGFAFRTPLILGGLLLAGFYHLIMEVFNNGRSIGKAAMNLRVIGIDGENPGVGSFLMRWMFRLVDITLSSGGIAILSFALTEKRQRLGDLLGGTVVIDEHKKTTHSLADIAESKRTGDEPEPSDSKEILYPEAALLTEEDLRKIDALYRKTRESGYHSDLRRKMNERMKAILEKKMGIASVDQPATEFIKQVYSDFITLQKQEQENEDVF